MAYDDNTAIIALKNGEEKALTWIYNKYIQLLRSHALNVVGCIKTAEDIVHDLFLILWEKRKNIHIYDLHIAWREKYQLTVTPIVLVNGYRLPVNYKIEDLGLITAFNIQETTT